MPKPNPLSPGLEQQQALSRVTSKPMKLIKPSGRPSRNGRVLVGGHFAPEVQTALQILAARERTTVKVLLAEGINTVFASRGKPEISEFTGGG